MTLRTLIFWPHLITGVVAGVLILSMSVTGALLTYERQLIAWSDSHLRSVPPAPGVARLPVETLLETARRHHPGIAPTAITIGSAAGATAVLAVEGGTRHLDAYSGRLLGEGATGVRRFMSGLRTWHRYIGVAGEGRPVAKAISGWANVLFLFIVASGIYLWFPRKWTWQRVRPVVLFKGGLRGKARDFNWHNVIGMWSAVPLFIVVVSAVPISFRWASDAVYRAVGEDPPAQGGRAGAAGGRAGGAAGSARGNAGGRQGDAAGGGRQRGESAGRERRAEPAAASFAGLNALWASAEKKVPGWRAINLRIPESARAPVVFAIDQGDGGQPHLRSTLTLSRETGEVVAYESFSGLTLGRRIRNVMRFAHTGEVLGIPGQTIAGLVSAGGAVMVWTGIALTLRRFIAWIRRRREPIAARERAA
jgi:uncharacterized iron-regulated membrane protein